VAKKIGRRALRQAATDHPMSKVRPCGEIQKEATRAQVLSGDKQVIAQRLLSMRNTGVPLRAFAGRG
jgi:hypothetical protein